MCFFVMCLWISSFSVPVNVCFSSQYAEGHKHLHAETKIHRKWIAALLQRVRGDMAPTPAAKLLIRKAGLCSRDSVAYCLASKGL